MVWSGFAAALDLGRHCTGVSGPAPEAPVAAQGPWQPWDGSFAPRAGAVHTPLGLRVAWGRSSFSAQRRPSAHRPARAGAAAVSVWGHREGEAGAVRWPFLTPGFRSLFHGRSLGPRGRVGALAAQAPGCLSRLHPSGPRGFPDASPEPTQLSLSPSRLRENLVLHPSDPPWLLAQRII